MPKVIIKDVLGLDGEYEFDFNFTHRDFRTIKQVANVRANEVEEALAAGDLDIIVAIAEIALGRNGVPHSLEQLWDSPAGSITLDVTDLEEAEDPPLPEDEPSSADERPSSGEPTNGSTESSPETLMLVNSGTPQPASTSALPT